jgi:hypothetical protein
MDVRTCTRSTICCIDEEGAMTGSDTERLDPVDIKITFVGPDLARIRAVLELSDGDARRAVLHFCDQPVGGRRLTLLDAGVVLRLRENDGNQHDRGQLDWGAEARLVLRPCWPERLTTGWTSPGPDGPRIRVAHEWTPHTRTVVATAACPVAPAVLRAALDAADRLPEAFPPHLRALFAAAAPHVAWSALRPFGPVAVRRWVRELDRLPVRVTQWTVRAAALDLLELSVTTEAGDAGVILPALLEPVRRHGVDPEAFAGSKTRTVLAALTGVRLGGPG